jgi:RNA polymerase sigma factor (sigma-70 family)
MGMETQERLELAEQIFAEHGPAIRAMIRRHAGNSAEEEDVYQNLYLSLVCNPVPAPLTNTLAYLNTVIKNDIIDSARRRKSYQEMISRYAVTRRYEERENNPEEDVMREEQVQRIVAYVESSLPTHEARAVAERYGSGHNTADTARNMHVKERTVSRYLCMGLKRIREAVTGLEIEEGICP